MDDDVALVGVELRRDGVPRAEVEALGRTGDDDQRDPGADGGLHPLAARVEDALVPVVDDLGQRVVDERVDGAGVDEVLHAGALTDGVEGDDLEAVVLQLLADAHDAGRGHAEHGDGDERLARLGVALGGLVAAGHAGGGVGGVAQHLLGDPVEPGDVGDGVHDHHVGVPDVGPGVVRPHRADDQLRHADAEVLQRATEQVGAAGAAQPEDGVDPALGAEVGDDRAQALAHLRDGHVAATGAALDAGGEVGEVHARPGGHLGGGDVGGEVRLAEDAAVDDEDVDVAGEQFVSHVGVLGALRVEGAGEADDGLAGHGHSFVTGQGWSAGSLGPASSLGDGVIGGVLQRRPDPLRGEREVADHDAGGVGDRGAERAGGAQQGPSLMPLEPYGPGPSWFSTAALISSTGTSLNVGIR